MTINTGERFKLIPAVHLFLFQAGQVLLLRRYNTGYEDGNYSVIAGHLDGGEEVKMAAIREAREEAGIEVALEDLEIIGVMHRVAEDERVDFFVAASRWQGEITNMEQDKCDQLAWFELKTLPPNVIPYVRHALAKYRPGTIWFESFGWD
ncbi:MAG TPA: NUDIX domain-containing protein [Chloroflexia bacterium]|nr:NUDIX domain-containing protein [Chloroflexia bacterium]